MICKTETKRFQLHKCANVEILHSNINIPKITHILVIVSEVNVTLEILLGVVCLCKRWIVERVHYNIETVVPIVTGIWVGRVNEQVLVHPNRRVCSKTYCASISGHVVIPVVFEDLELRGKVTHSLSTIVTISIIGRIALHTYV